MAYLFAMATDSTPPRGCQFPVRRTSSRPTTLCGVRWQPLRFPTSLRSTAQSAQTQPETSEHVCGPTALAGTRTTWESLIRKHREVLNISLDPPETKRILLKTKNF